jgi:sorbitol-specific phosphotransferase system component IIC
MCQVGSHDVRFFHGLVRTGHVPLLTFTIAMMPALMASGNEAQVSTMACKEASAAIGRYTATDAFAAPGFFMGSNPFFGFFAPQTLRKRLTDKGSAA